MAHLLLQRDYGHRSIVLKGAVGYLGCVAVVDVNSSLRKVPVNIKLIDESFMYD